jgi:hypothetical protein
MAEPLDKTLRRELFRTLTLFYTRGLGLVVLNVMVVQPYDFFLSVGQNIY